jgi:small subunit ribosomal protein S6
MEKMLTSYEAMFIVSVANGDEAAKTTVSKFVDMIAANGEIVETAEWGRRRLAYPIQDMNEGYYVVVTFKSEGAFPQELLRIANIDETVIRSLVVKLEYDAAEAATKKAAAAQAAALAAEAAAKAAAEAAAAEAAETEAAEPAVDAE